MNKKSNKATETVVYTNSIPHTPLRFIFFVTRPHRVWLIAVLLVVILASALSQSTSYFFKLIVDAAEAGNLNKVYFYGLLFPVAVFFVQLLYRLSGRLGMQLVTRTMKTGTDLLTEYTFRHSHSYFSNRFAGSIMTKYGNAIGAIGEVFPELLWTHLTAFVSFIVTFAFILFIDPVSAFLFLGLTIVLVIFNRWLAPRKRELSRKHAESRSALNAKTIDILTNISAVRQYARIEHEVDSMRELTTKKLIAHRNNWLYTESMLLYNSIILFLFGFAMFWSLLTKWNNGVITTGELVLVLSLISQITGTLIFIGRAINETARAFGEMEEGLDDLLIDYEITNVPNALALGATAGSIEWRNVSFMYAGKSVFNDFGLNIKPGERVGLVGHSGAGKTTFVSLLLRQHDLNAGQILIDGQDISQVTQDSLREHIAVVPQEPLLFHRSIRDNIAYGKPSATMKEIEEVAKKAQAHEFIIDLENGYDTLVGERGVKLSGGQKQRIAIARAMLKDAPILILDEATSALDSESEVLIQKALKELMEGKTVIAVAHRLSTLREMDRIIVLENGQIIEDGNHQELAHADGVYQKLWEHQAGGFLQE